MRDPREENYYDKILNNFDQFCDEFEFAAAKRFSGQDNDSRQPIDNSAVQRETPRAVREINYDGEEVNLLTEDAIDVSPTKRRETREDI
tara:strand:+ start:7885 stop:8151 length:267 start_codon:yes stop_codon:yes gene_type:complete